MVDYPVSVDNIGYFSGTIGSATDHIAGTWPQFGSCGFDWFWGGVTGVEIVGFKVVFDASAGDGYMFWNFTFDNPGWPGSPEWTADPGVSHIALHNSYAGNDSAIHVSGPTHYEWRFYWPGDPTFGGFVFNDPLSDLLISLDRGAPYYYVYGSLNAGTVTTPIVVDRFDLVLLTQTVAAPCRLYPRADGRGLGAGRRWPPDRVTR